MTRVTQYFKSVLHPTPPPPTPGLCSFLIYTSFETVTILALSVFVLILASFASLCIFFHNFATFYSFCIFCKYLQLFGCIQLFFIFYYYYYFCKLLPPFQTNATFFHFCTFLHNFAIVLLFNNLDFLYYCNHLHCAR